MAAASEATLTPDAAGVLTTRSDGELGTWMVSEWLPPRAHPLAGAIERIWYFDGCLAFGCERLFPNGKLELVIQLDAAYRPAGGLDAYPALSVTGMLLGPLAIEAPWGRCRVLGIRLTPAGARTILGHPLRELLDTTVDLEALAGRPALELAERAHGARSGAAAVRAAVAWSYDRFSRAAHGDAWLAWSLARIEATAGNLSLAALRAEAGRPPGRFSTPFAREIGVTPKRYARLMRFRRTIAALYDGADDVDSGRVSLADIAFAAGYYDQPHMQADFREHAGMTPGDFLRARKYPGSLSLPESHR